MAIPPPWAAVILTLGAFRLVRLVGWDDLPPIERFRDRLTGKTVYHNAAEGGYRYQFRRPLLAHFLGCPFCQGFWISLAVYGAWLLEPNWTLYLLAPWALSAAVGLIAKQWDP